MTKIVPVLLSYFALAACGPTDNVTGPGGVSIEDAGALDEAAVKLDSEAQVDPITSKQP